jgi:hypothetical protein
MGKGRDKRRRTAKSNHEVRPAKVESGGESLGSIDPYARVLAPLKPKPSLRSGAIALHEPDEPELLLSDAISVRSIQQRNEK